MADFQTVGLEHNIAVLVALAAPGPRTTSITWGAWCAVALRYTIAIRSRSSVALRSTIAVNSRSAVALRYTITVSSRSTVSVASRLHWAVAVILTSQPLQREHIAVSIVRYVDTDLCDRLLDRTLFPALIAWVNAPITAPFSAVTAALGPISTHVNPITARFNPIATANRAITVGPVPTSTALSARLIAATTITARGAAPLSRAVTLLVAPRPPTPRLL
jgi:hypothetical protein